MADTTPTINIDVRDGERARLSQQGWEYYRIAVVSGLTSGSSAVRIKAAFDLLATLTPPINYAVQHPDIPGAKLEEIDGECPSVSTVKLRLIYREHFSDATLINNTILEVGASLVQVQRNKDVNGSLITVSYNGTTYPAEITFLQPQVTANFTRQVIGSPLAAARIFVGKVNAGGWAIDTTAAAGAWLCTGIIGRSQDGGRTYQTTYSFQANTGPNGWQPTVVFRDSTGRVPPDVTASNGTTQVTAYDSEDFNALALH